jgi:hypothetical protein
MASLCTIAIAGPIAIYDAAIGTHAARAAHPNNDADRGERRMSKDKSPANADQPATAERLLQLQAVQFGTKRGAIARMAKYLGVSSQRWHNTTKRGLPLGRKLEDILMEKFPGLTRDWIRTGDARGLSEEMVEKLKRVSPNPAPLAAKSLLPIVDALDRAINFAHGVAAAIEAKQDRGLDALIDAHIERLRQIHEQLERLGGI